MRVFLDANILFSAGNTGSRIAQLVDVLIAHTEPVTDALAKAEAQRNVLLKRPAWSENLNALLDRIELAPSAMFELPVTLSDKDRPILCAAIGARCQYLLTGDVRDFGHLFGVLIHGVTVVTPMQLAERLESQGILRPRNET